MIKKFFKTILEAIIAARMAKAQTIIKGYRGS
jgi:hypothetical protein